MLKSDIKTFFISQYLYNRIICINFTRIEPTTPLNDAKLVGHFLFI